MARAPRRSGWAAFIGWFPARDVREARTFLGHVGLTLIMLAGLWVLEHAFVWLFQEHDPKLFAGIPVIGGIPVKWFFDAADAGVLLRFAYRAIFEPWRKRRR